MKVYPNSLLRKMDAQTESLSAAGTGLENVGKTKSRIGGPAGKFNWNEMMTEGNKGGCRREIVEKNGSTVRKMFIEKK